MSYIKMVEGIPFVLGPCTFNLTHVRSIFLEEEGQFYVNLGGGSFVRVCRHQDEAFFEWFTKTFT